MTLVIFSAVVALALLVWAVVLYNGLVSAELRVREGWSAIDVQLQRRSSLIPNLVEVVKGYASFERDTLTRVIDARSALGAAAGPASAARANLDLTSALHALFAVAEAYPDLKASEHFSHLQRDLADTENQIAYARNYYNGAVEAYNVRAETVPGVFVARALSFRPAEFFSANAPDRAVPSVR